MNMFNLGRIKTGCSLPAVIILMLSTLQVIAEEQQVTPEGKQPGSEKLQLLAKNSFVYKPPFRGAPSARVGAGTRGQGLNGPHLYVLTPDHAGLTINAQPDLYWYVSEPVDARYQFAIIEDATLKTVLESEPAKITRAGIQKMSLKDHGFKLQPGIEYQWFVSVIDKNNQHSADIVASGIIERVDITRRLADRLASGIMDNGKLENVEKAIIYAEESIWYDAIASISAIIELKPRDKTLRGMRASLMEQAGLQEVADYDRKMLN